MLNTPEMKSWETTVAGMVPLIVGILAIKGYIVPAEYIDSFIQILTLVGGAAIGFFAKSARKTGAGKNVSTKEQGTKLNCDPLTIGIIILGAMIFYGASKAQAAEPWLDLTIDQADVLKMNKYPSLGIKINEPDQGFAAQVIWSTGMCIKVRGICLINPVLYGGLSQQSSNNLPVNGGIGARSFLRIVTVGYGYDTAAGHDEARVLIDAVRLIEAGYGGMSTVFGR